MLAFVRSSRAFPVLLAATAACFLVTFYWIFFRAPVEAVMGSVQKIFYVHVPSAYAMYLSATACFVGSAWYIYDGNERGDTLARAGGEVAVVFGAIVLTTGPIWARPAWGVYWTWEPRLLTSLLSTMIYVSYVVLRSFAGHGDAERKFAAVLGMMGFSMLPIIHYSVQKLGGNHPRVISTGGGGLRHPDMKIALGLGFASFTLLALAFLWMRARLHSLESRLTQLEDEASALGRLGEET